MQSDYSSLKSCLDNGIEHHFSLDLLAHFIPDFLSVFTKRASPKTSTKPPEIKSRSHQSFVGKLHNSTVFDFLSHPSLEAHGTPSVITSLGINNKLSPLSLVFVGTLSGKVIVLNRDDSGALSFVGLLPLRVNRRSSPIGSFTSIDAKIIHTYSASSSQLLTFGVLVAVGDVNGHIIVWELPLLQRTSTKILVNISNATLLKIIEQPVSPSSSLPTSALSQSDDSSKIVRAEPTVMYVAIVDGCDGRLQIVGAWNTGLIALFTLSKALLTVNLDHVVLMPANDDLTPSSLVQSVTSPAVLPHRPSACGVYLFTNQLLMLSLSPVLKVVAAVSINRITEAVGISVDPQSGLDWSVDIEPLILNQKRSIPPIPRVSVLIQNFLVILTVIPHDEAHSTAEQQSKSIGRFTIEQVFELSSEYQSQQLSFTSHKWNALNSILLLTSTSVVFPLELGAPVTTLSQLQGGNFARSTVALRVEESVNVVNITLLSQSNMISRGQNSVRVPSFCQSFVIDAPVHHSLASLNESNSVVLLGQDSIVKIDFRPNVARTKELIDLGMYYDALCLIYPSEIIDCDFIEPSSLLIDVVKELSRIKFSSKDELVQVFLFLTKFSIKHNCMDTLFAVDLSAMSKKFQKCFFTALEELLLTYPPLLPADVLPPTSTVKDALGYVLTLDGGQDRCSHLLLCLLDHILASATYSRDHLLLCISYCTQLSNPEICPEELILCHYSVFVVLSRAHSESFQRGLDLISTHLDDSFISSLFGRICSNEFPIPLRYSISQDIVKSFLNIFTYWLTKTSGGHACFLRLVKRDLNSALVLLFTGFKSSSLKTGDVITSLIDSLIDSSLFPLLSSLEELNNFKYLSIVLEYLALDLISSKSIFTTSTSFIPIRPLIRILTHLTSSSCSNEPSEGIIPFTMETRSIVMSTLVRNIRKLYLNLCQFSSSDIAALSSMALNNGFLPSSVFLTAINDPIKSLNILIDFKGSDDDLLPFSIVPPPSSTLKGICNIVEALFADNYKLKAKPFSPDQHSQFEKAVVQLVPTLATLNPSGTAFLSWSTASCSHCLHCPCPSITAVSFIHFISSP
ncbi:hypothetical protein GEMRC1_003583 [Eukaryota sp. GEM-RC1]